MPNISAKLRRSGGKWGIWGMVTVFIGQQRYFVGEQRFLLAQPASFSVKPAPGKNFILANLPTINDTWLPILEKSH
jgi:hypothetical protein